MNPKCKKNGKFKGLYAGLEPIVPPFVAVSTNTNVVGNINAVVVVAGVSLTVNTAPLVSDPVVGPLRA